MMELICRKKTVKKHREFESKIIMERSDADQLKKSNEEQSMTHSRKLMEISEAYDEHDAIIICRIFARRFPDIMYESLKDEHDAMVELIAGINQMNGVYSEKSHTER